MNATNRDVLSQNFFFLYKVYLNVSNLLVPEIQYIEMEFVKKCVTIIEPLVAQSKEEETKEYANKLIIRLLFMIRNFMD